MFPIRDDNPTSSVPWVTNLLIVINLVVFGYELSIPREKLDLFFRTWGFIPAHVTSTVEFNHVLRTLTSMFLHGGIFHVGGNMLFLWVFGDNVEDELGHGQYILFYLASGIGAVVSQYVAAPTSQVPMVGASGAISGIMGAYMLLYPTTPVLTAIVIIVIIRMVYIPAWFFLGYWFLIQFLSGTMSMAAEASGGGGVAWFAHVGGFVVGFLWVIVHGSVQFIKNKTS